ncbi:MAG TPA: transposase, partial [Trebonia sp.]
RLREGGRMVGIVSHVSELRQRIPARIHVRKGHHGSSVSVTEVPRALRTVHPLGWAIWKGVILTRAKKSFSPEFRDEAVKLVIETSRPIARVAKELGINEGTLGNW